MAFGDAKSILEFCAASQDLFRLEAEVKAELDEAVEFARSSPYPDPADALEHVYA